MSDFLSNLIARGAGLGDAIRPRTLSLFEPSGVARSAAALAFAAPESVDSISEDQPAPPPQAVPPRPALAPRRQPPAASETAGAERHSESRDVPAARVAPAPAPAVAPARPDPPALPATWQDAPARTDPPPLRATRQDAPAAPPPPAPSVKDAPNDPVVQPAVRPAAAAERPQMAPRPFEQREPLRPDRAPAAQATPPQPPGAALIPKPLAAPVSLTPHHRPSMPKPAAAAPPLAEPEIHVTIGRIEVRAIAEERPSKQERRPSAVLGLDEYLRVRAKGAGR